MNTVFPKSTLNVPGLFAVRTASVKLADLTNDSGLRLGELVPKKAVTVAVRNVGIHDGSCFIQAPDGKRRLGFEESIELPHSSLDTHSISAEGDEGHTVVVSYTRLAQDRE